METILSNKDQKAIIGPDYPFAIIGERINPTRRKKLAETMAAGDFSVAQEDARKQIAAGAAILDVNAGIPGADEPALLKGAVQAVLEVASVPLCLDSANPEALKTVGDPLGTEEFGFIFTPGSDLVEPFNAAIATMDEDGFLEHLNTRWFFLYDPTAQ